MFNHTFKPLSRNPAQLLPNGNICAAVVTTNSTLSLQDNFYLLILYRYPVGNT